MKTIPSVTKIIILVSQKKRYIYFENQYFFKKINHQPPRRTGVVPLVVEFFKNIDCQRRYDAFSETHIELFLLHSVP